MIRTINKEGRKILVSILNTIKEINKKPSAKNIVMSLFFLKVTPNGMNNLF
jgi:hypothetical protein